MPRPLVAVLACAFAAAACSGVASEPTPRGVTSSASEPSPSGTHPGPSEAPSPSVSPIPDGAVLVETGAGPDELDIVELAPSGTDPTGSWSGTVGGSDVVVVAVAGAGDAFSRDRVLWRWTRRPDLGGWLGVELASYPARKGVLGLDVTVVDVTGDGHDDGLAFALTGGSGACGTWTVYDLATTARLWSRDLCDGTVDPSVDPVGLAVQESVYRAGDPHCCPSARRETVLTYGGTETWDVVRRRVVELS